MKSRKLAFAVMGVMTLFYPLAIWLGHGRLQPKTLALLLLALGIVRLLSARSFADGMWWALGAFVLALLAASGNTLLPLKLYPVLVNAALLAVFGLSLLRPPSLVERIARAQNPELTPHGIRYTRRVTQLWCGFFVVNGAIAGATAVWASQRTWSLYTGVVSYVLMGLLFGGEYLVRRRQQARHAL